jgi:4-aminobutyrate aminotransferase-like enzyme
LHTSTFLGSPLGCRMALASLERHADPTVSEQVRERGRMLRKALRAVEADCIGNIRGIGLMTGVELIRPGGEPDAELAVAIVKRGLRDGLILLAGSPAGNVLSFAPAFAISEEEIEFLRAKLQEYVTSLPGSIS